MLGTALPFALLGGLLGLDMVSFPQIMIARPIVSATVAGALAGHPASGVLIGAVLELIALETLPFGAVRYAEWGSAGTVGGAVFAAQPAGAPGALPVGVLAALLAAVCSSWSMVLLRKANGRYARTMRAQIDAGSSAAVTAVQLRGLVMDLFRGVLVTLVLLLIFLPVGHALVSLWKVDAVHSRAVVATIATTVAAGAVWKLFHASVRGGWLFLLGLAVGGALVFVAP